MSFISDGISCIDHVAMRFDLLAPRLLVTEAVTENHDLCCFRFFQKCNIIAETFHSRFY